LAFDQNVYDPNCKVGTTDTYLHKLMI
jgi:hypothetical protein